MFENNEGNFEILLLRYRRNDRRSSAPGSQRGDCSASAMMPRWEESLQAHTDPWEEYIQAHIDTLTQLRFNWQQSTKELVEKFDRDGQDVARKYNISREQEIQRFLTRLRTCQNTREEYMWAHPDTWEEYIRAHLDTLTKLGFDWQQSAKELDEKFDRDGQGLTRNYNISRQQEIQRFLTRLRTRQPSLSQLDQTINNDPPLDLNNPLREQNIPSIEQGDPNISHDQPDQIINLVNIDHLWDLDNDNPLHEQNITPIGQGVPDISRSEPFQTSWVSPLQEQDIEVDHGKTDPDSALILHNMLSEAHQPSLSQLEPSQTINPSDLDNPIGGQNVSSIEQEYLLREQNLIPIDQVIPDISRSDPTQTNLVSPLQEQDVEVDHGNDTEPDSTLDMSEARGQSINQTGETILKRRRRVTKACSNCHRMKMRCDEKSPSCDRCSRLRLKCSRDQSTNQTGEIILEGRRRVTKEKSYWKAVVVSRRLRRACDGEEPYGRCWELDIECQRDEPIAREVEDVEEVEGQRGLPVLDSIAGILDRQSKLSIQKYTMADERFVDDEIDELIFLDTKQLKAKVIHGHYYEGIELGSKQYEAVQKQSASSTVRLLRF
ncbi:hypothetical protein BX600DRAFT_431802 [Xylariales sp. PMI_506]|nr:hypothetical protein BX600DRAFT_431802 [Xylariales sp. PMI_506]